MTTEQIESRASHLQWCKTRALAYVDDGNIREAFASMMSDLRKHPDTANHVGMLLGHQMMVAGLLNSAPQMREFIEGFN